MTAFNPNYFHKGPICKYSHTGVLDTRILGRSVHHSTREVTSPLRLRPRRPYVMCLPRRVSLRIKQMYRKMPFKP